ncbi:MAG: SOS response-associated peptidase [Erysipelotrichaceae bacterium]|nr:SOS response-associated peptidase [Erysipelotrichaceae bacterium]
MCGRYVGFSISNDEELENLLKEVLIKTNTSTLNYTLKTNEEIFPNDVVPVFLLKNNKLQGHPMRWGFIGKDNKLIINTRSETINDLYTWKDIVKTNRCIIPSNGFYEWNKQEKTKYLFKLENTENLYMAGLYKIFNKDNEKFVHFSIITTSSNNSVKDIHNRMPVIIRRDEFDKWLSSDYESLLNRNNIILKRKLVV